MKRKFKTMISGILTVATIATSLMMPVTASAYMVEYPDTPQNICPPVSHRLQWEGDGGYLPLDFDKLFDLPVRDTNVGYVPATATYGGDYYYMIGTTEPSGWWSHSNTGVRMWRSADLKNWEDLGIVWNIADSKWAESVETAACWAPEFRYIEKYDNFYITYSSSRSGNGILVSSTGKPEGPYVEIADNAAVKQDRFNIDGSLFEDEDGKLYYLWQDGMIAEISLRDEQGNDEVRYLSDPVLLGLPASEHQQYKNVADSYEIEHVGFEGVYMVKVDGKYYLSCAEFNNNGGNIDAPQMTYDCMVAVADNIMGPYRDWHLAVRGGGHNNFFFDRDGQLWSTYFGNDNLAVNRERPAILKMEVNEEGHLQPLWEGGEINLAQMEGATVTATSVWPHDPVTYAAEKATDGKLSTRWAASDADFEKPAGLTVDLGKECVISGTRTYFEYPTERYNYTIETSSNGEDWTTYATRSGDVAGAPIDRGNGLVKARYVKITASDRTGDAFLSSIWEFQVYGWEEGMTAAQVASVVDEIAAPVKGDTELTLPELPEGFTAVVKSSSDETLVSKDGKIALPANATDVEVVLTITGEGTSADTEAIDVTLPSAQENLALGKTAIASSQQDNDRGPEKAVDGDSSTRWAANGNAMPQTLTIDLGQAYDVNSVETEFEMTERYVCYKIETSVDNENWQMFADRTDNNVIGEVFVDAVEQPMTARYVRMTVTKAQYENFDWASIWEMRVYGDEVAESLNVTAEAGENGTVTCDAVDGKVELGEKVTFNFQPDAGYKVDKVTVNGEEVALKALRQYTINGVSEDVELKVTFAEDNSGLDLVASYDMTVEDGKLVDLSGNGNDANLVNFSDSDFVTDGTDKELVFDGVDNYVELPAGLVEDEQFVVEAIFQTDVQENSWLWNFGTGTENNYVFVSPRFGADAGHLRSGIKYAGTEQLFANGNAAQIGNAETVVRMEFNLGTLTLYVNGKEAGTIASGHSLQTILAAGNRSDISGYIGKSLYAVDPAFEGTLTQFDVYATPKATVTAIEVAAPDKTEYTEGEELDLTGMVVAATYSNGDVKVISEGEYEVSGYEANTIGEQTITVTYEGQSATFTVTVNVATVEPGPLPYEDVTENDWFYDAVYYNYIAKTMTGMDETHFGPYGQLSRAQFALILYRMEGEPEVQTEKSFLDISGDEWYGQAVLWAAEAGIVTGYQNGCYGPVDMITREQMAVMMYRYAKYLEKDVTKVGDISEFLDASSVSPFATEALAWANGMGIITGKENGTMLAPQANTARAEAAAIIERYMR